MWCKDCARIEIDDYDPPTSLKSIIMALKVFIIPSLSRSREMRIRNRTIHLDQCINSNPVACLLGMCRLFQDNEKPIKFINSIIAIISGDVTCIIYVLN